MFIHKAYNGLNVITYLRVGLIGYMIYAIKLMLATKCKQEVMIIRYIISCNSIVFILIYNTMYTICFSCYFSICHFVIDLIYRYIDLS